MNKLRYAMLRMGLLLALLATALAARVGEPAPDFTSVDSNGKSQRLSDYKGKWLVLFFYPLDFTFICPTEITEFSRRYHEFKEQNAEILAGLGALAGLEFPLMVGPSRKSFLPQSENASDSFLQCATAAAVTASILGGAHVVRVHDVAEMKAAVQVADQILNVVGTLDSSASRVAPPRSGGSASRK